MNITKEQFKEIADNILLGLTEEEACLLCDVSYDDYLTLLDDAKFKKFIDKQKVQFKKKHLENIDAKKSDKNSMWALEKLRPDEFAGKPKSENPTNLIAVLVRQIQKGNYQEPLVLNGEQKT